MSSAAAPFRTPPRDTSGGTEPQKYTSRHGVTRFEGIVTDPDRLRDAVITGVGRARTYGCGLLSIGFSQEQP